MPLEYLVDDKFLEQMDSKLTGWTDPVARLRHALEKDEFELYCQPIVSLAGGERYPMGEVLVRMREEEKALLAQLTSNQVAPDRLLFEIDESDVLQRPELAAKFAAAYRALGGRLLLDGFGRRSVSFASIKALGVDFVKVDGSITRRLLTSESARTKMSAILRVGEALKFAVVAECVEEQDILLRLKALGTGFAQGFGISKPQPIAAVAGG
jgi:EAL domain-containing protein (putative c-di-GMP-specific phosphodiesterase class I)